MSITFDCDCGKQLQVADAFAGKRAKCPACGSVRAVPAPFELDREGRSDGPEPPRAPRRARRVADHEEEVEYDEDGEPRPLSRWQDEDPDLLARRRDRAERKADEKREQRRKQKRGEIVGGAVAMGVGCLWLFALVFGKGDFDPYPAILIVGGMVSFILGLAGAGDDDPSRE